MYSQTVQLSANKSVSSVAPCLCAGERADKFAFDERKVITIYDLRDELPQPRRKQPYRRPAWSASEQPVAFLARNAAAHELFMPEEGNEFLPFVDQSEDPAARGRLVLFTSDGDQDVEVYALPLSQALVAVDRG